MDTYCRELSVMVWGQPHVVTVYRKSETVYEVVGNYMCETSVGNFVAAIRVRVIGD